MAKQPAKVKSPALPSWAGLLFEGTPTKNPTSSETTFAGDSKNDAGLVAGMQQNEVRAMNQSAADKWGNGAVKLLGTALTSFAEPFVDLTYGLGRAVATGVQGGDAGAMARSIYDNEATQGFDELNEYLQKQFPNYYSKTDEQKNLLEQLGTTNFWADKVGNGLGFTVGAIASGLLTGGIGDALETGSLLGNVAKAAKVAEAIEAGESGAAILSKVAKTANNAERWAGGRAVASNLLGAMGESGMEARQIATDTEKALREKFPDAAESWIKDQAEAAGNVGFAYNMALVGGSNALQFGRLFKKGYQAERAALGAIEELADGTFSHTPKTGWRRATQIGGKLLLNNLEEATQEQLQYVGEKSLPAFYSHKNNSGAQQDFNDFLSTVADGFQEAYGTKEGWENGLLGFLIGGTGAITNRGEQSRQDEATKTAVDRLNQTQLKPALKGLWESAVAANSYQKEREQALKDGNLFDYKTKEFQQFATLVQGQYAAGRFNDFLKKLEEVGSLSPEEFKRTYALGTDAVLPKSPQELSVELKQKANELREISQHLESAYPSAEQANLRQELYMLAGTMRDSERREKKLSAEINELTNGELLYTTVQKASGTEDYRKVFATSADEWLNNASNDPIKRSQVASKALDMLSLGKQREQLIDVYNKLQNPDYQRRFFEKAQVAAQVAPAVVQPSVAPTPVATTSIAPAAPAIPAPTASAASVAPTAPKATAPPAAGQTVSFKIDVPGQSSFTATTDLNGNLISAVGTRNNALPVDKLTKNFGKEIAAGFAATPKPASAPARNANGLTDAQQAISDKLEDLKQNMPTLSADASVYQKEGKDYLRASTLKEELLTSAQQKAGRAKPSKQHLADNPHYSDRGNVSDEIVRDFFLASGSFSVEDAKKVYEDYIARVQQRDGRDVRTGMRMTDSFFKELVDDLNVIKGKLDAGGFVVHSDTGTLYGTIAGKEYAGTMDLVAIHPSGKAYIIDIKTAESSRRNDYLKEDIGKGTERREGSDGPYWIDESKYREGDYIQQGIYQELLKQRTGIEVTDRLIFPIITKGKGGVYESAKLEPSKEGSYSISLNKLSPLTIDELIKKYAPAPAIAPSLAASILGNPANKRSNEVASTAPSTPVASGVVVPTLFGPVTETGVIEGRKLSSESPLLAIGIQPIGTSAGKFTLSPSVDKRRLIGDGLSRLDKFFESNTGSGKILDIAIATPGELFFDGNNWSVTKKGMLNITWSNPAATPIVVPSVPIVAIAESIGVQENAVLDYWTSNEDLLHSRAREEWRSDILQGKGVSNPVWAVYEAAPKESFSLYTEHNGVRLKIGYLPAASKGLTGEMAAKNAATQQFKELVKQKGIGVAVPLRFTYSVGELDNKQTTPSNSSLTLADMDDRYKYNGQFKVYSWRKMGTQDTILPVIGSYDRADDTEIVSRYATSAGTDGYIMKVSTPDGGHQWVGLGVKPIDGKQIQNLWKALTKTGTHEEKDAQARQLNTAFFAAYNGTDHSVLFDGGRLSIWQHGSKEGKPVGYLYPREGVAIPSTLQELKAALKPSGLGERTVDDVLSYIGLQVSAHDTIEEKLAKLVPNTSKQLWKNLALTPEGIRENSSAPMPALPTTAVTPAPSVQLEAAPSVPLSVQELAKKKLADLTKEERVRVREYLKEQAEKEKAQKGDLSVYTGTALSTGEKLISTDWAQAKKNVANIVPEGVSVKHVTAFAEHALLSGREIGAAFAGVVYLADNVTKGTEWHEAFHILEQSVFTSEELSRLDTVSARMVDTSKAAITAFRKQYPEYAGNDALIASQIKREFRANSFQDYMNNRPGVLKRFWERLKAFLGFVKDNRMQLEDIFEKVARGGFKHRNLIIGNEGPEYKTIPYAGVAQSDKIVRLLTARLHNRLNQLGELKASKERRNEVLRALIRERLLEDSVPMGDNTVESFTAQKLFWPELDELEDEDFEDMMLYRKAYYEPESIAAIGNQVGYYWKFIGAEASEEKDEEQDDAVAEGALADDDSSQTRDFDAGLMDVSNIDNMDEAVKLFIALTTYGEGRDEQAIDFVHTVDLMFRNLENVRSLDEMRKILRKRASQPGNPQLKAVVDKIEQKLMSGDGDYFGQALFHSFYKQLVSPEDILVNKDTGKITLTSADQNNLEVRRLNQFAVNFDLWSARKEHAAAIQNVRGAVNDLRREVTPEAVEILKQNLPFIGLDLHPAFLEEVVAGTNKDYLLNGVATNQRNLLDDLGQINAQVMTGANPYNRKDSEGEENKNSVATRAKALAKADAYFQPALNNGSYQNPEGKSQYPFVSPSYVLERGRDIQDGKVTFTSEIDSLNPLVQREQREAGFFKTLKLRPYGGVREETAGDGKAFKSLDPKSYLIGAFALYRSGRVQFTQFEAKSSTLTLQVPSFGKDRLTTKDNGLTEQGLGYLRNFFKQDMLLNEKVFQELETLPDEALEKNYHFKSYDKENKPIRVTREHWEKAYNMEPGAARSKAISSLPRGLQILQLPMLNGLTLLERSDATKVDALLTEEMMAGKEAFVQSLLAADLDPSDAATKNLLMQGVEGYMDVTEYAGEMLMQDFIWRNAYSQLQRGSEAHFKDSIDITKRAAGMLAAGAHWGKGTYKMAVLATDTVYINTDTLQTIDETDASFEQLKAAGKISAVDATDASGHMLDTRFQAFLKAFGKSTPEINAHIQQLIDGEDFKWRPDMGWVANALKNVIFGGDSPYVKTATQAMFVQDLGLNMGKDYKPISGQVSYTSPNGNVWVAKPQSERLFNLFVQMKEQGIDEVYHDTAVKEKLRGQNFRDAEGFYGNGRQLIAQEIQNSDWRQQVENPSGKMKIVHGTQLLQLLDSNMVDSDIVSYEGKESSVGELRAEYQRLLSAIRQDSATKAFALLDQMVNGTSVFKQSIVSGLEASGTDQNTLDFFKQVAGKNEWQHSMDLPNVQLKYQQLFLAHFNKNVFSQKAPGLKLTLLPSSMRSVVVDATDNVVHDFGKADNKQVYLDANGRLKEGYRSRPLQMHGPVYDKDGKLLGIKKAEVILSEEILSAHGITRDQLYSNEVSEEVRDAITSMLGFRIPTQSHHSMLPYKVVGWLPAYTGSVVVAPAAITYLSGADYDVDSLFVLRREWYSDKGKLKLYGTATDVETKWKEYLKYQEANNKGYVAAVRDAKLLGMKDTEVRKQLGMPVTLEEFSALPAYKQETNYGRYNQLMDVSMALALNANNWESARTPASTDPANKAIGWLTKFSGRGADSKAPYNLLDTQYKHWWANSSGKDVLGIAALGNTGVAFATKAQLKLDAEPIQFLGASLSGFTELSEQDIHFTEKDGRLLVVEDAAPKSKADSNSTFVSVAADNVKEQAVAKGNLSGLVLPQAGAATGLGAGFNRTMLFAHQPVLWELSERSAALDNDWSEKVSSFKINADLHDHLVKLLGGQVMTDYAPTAQDAADALSFRIPEKSRTFTPDEIKHLNVQLQVLDTYNRLALVSEDLGRISAVLGLSKGVGASLADLDDKLAAAKHVVGKNTSLNITEALAGESLLSQNMGNLQAVEGATTREFLVRSTPVRKLLKLVEGVTSDGQGGTRLKSKDMQQLQIDYLTFLNIRAFDSKLTTQTKYNLASRQNLLEDTEHNIAAQYTRMLEAHPSLRKNIFLRSLTVVRPSKGSKQWGLAFNSRQKADATYTEKLTDSLIELSGHEAKDVQAFYRGLFLYLGVKTNFQFKNGSFIKLMPTTRMQVLSDGLNAVSNAIRREDDAEVAKVMGYRTRRGFVEFLRHWFSNPDNQRFVTQLRLPFKMQKGVMTVANGKMHLSVKGATKEQLIALMSSGVMPRESGDASYPLFLRQVPSAENRQEGAKDIIWERVKTVNGGADYRVLVANNKLREQAMYHLTADEAVGKGKVEEIEITEPTSPMRADGPVNGSVGTIESPLPISPAPIKDTEKPVAPTTSVRTDNTFTFPDGTTIATGAIALNAQQQDALVKLSSFVLGKGKTAFTLQGYAGTGKTTITKFFLSWLRKQQIEVEMSTPTHRAKAVLQQLSGREAMTMHKMLGLRADVAVEELNLDDLKFKKEGEGKMPKGGLIIVDEASMVNDALYGELLRQAGERGTKVIFIGDEGQIKPVKQDHVSKVFTQDKVSLTKVERQQNGNPLGPILDTIRADQRSAKDLFAHSTSVNEKGEGVVFSNSTAAEDNWLEENFGGQDFAGNKNHARVLAGTNAAVQAYNKKAREVIYGDAAKSNEYLPGEVLTGYANWAKASDGGPLITNSVDYEILTVEPAKYTLSGIPTEGYRVYSQEVGNPRNRQSFYVLSRNSDVSTFTKLNAESERLRQVAINTGDGGARKRAWVAYYTFLESFAMPVSYAEQGKNRKTGLLENQVKLKKTLDYGYALTTHKSQGGTFTNALVLEDDIDKAFTGDSQLRNQLKYVAFSRVSNQLFAKTSKAEAPVATALSAATNGASAVTAQEQQYLDQWEQLTLPERHLDAVEDKLFFIRKRLSGQVVENCFL